MAAQRVRPFTGSSYTLNDTVEVQGLDAASIRRSQEGRREAVAARSTVLPHRNQVFADNSRVGQVRAILARQRARDAAARVEQMRYVENEIGQLRGQEVVDMAIPLIPEREREIVDDRVPLAQRREERNSSIRVGATEIVVDGYASAHADTAAALVLYDARHSNNRNAILGAAVMSLSSSQPMRVVFRSPMRFALTPQVNDHLHCAIVSPDSDMGDSVAAMLRSGVVCQLDRGSHEELLTTNQLRAEVEDQAAAVLYTARNCRVLQPALRPPPLQGDFEINFRRSVSSRFTPRGFVEREGPARESFSFSLRPQVVQQWQPVVPSQEVSGSEFDQPSSELRRSVGQALEPMQINNAITTIDVVGSDDARTVWTSSFELPTEVLPGTQITTFSLATIMSGTGPLARRLSLALRCAKKLEVQLCCKLPQNSGLGLAIVYGQYMPTQTTYVLKSVLSMEHHIWNPAMEPLVSYDFNVCSTGPWSPVWAEGMGGNFAIVGVSNWSNPPTSTSAVEIRVLLTNEDIVPHEINVTNVRGRIQLNRFCGTHEFAQGRHAAPVAVELSLGSPTMASNGYVETQGAALLAMYSCWKADIVVEITRLCSPFVGGTITCAILAGNKVNTITRATVNDVPNVKFVVPTGKTGVTFTIPAELMGWAYSTERLRVDSAGRRQRGLCLALWIVDAVTASDTSTFNVAVEIKELLNVTSYGHGYGYEPKATRCQAGVDSLMCSPPLFNQMWHDWLYVDYAKAEDKDVLRYDFNPSAALEIGPEGTQWKMNNSSFLRVLKTSVWWKGRLWYKIIWAGSEKIKRSERTGRISAIVNWDGVGSQAANRLMSGKASGEFVGSLDFYGINDGYQLMAPGLTMTSAWPRLSITTTKTKEFHTARVQIMPDPNFSVSGARIAPSVVISGVTGKSEFSTT